MCVSASVLGVALDQGASAQVVGGGTNHLSVMISIMRVHIHPSVSSPLPPV